MQRRRCLLPDPWNIDRCHELRAGCGSLPLDPASLPPHRHEFLAPGQWHGNGSEPSVISAVSVDSAGKWDARVPLLIIGAGAAGICAALAAKEPVWGPS
jgi:hypothetical protein